MHDGSHTYETIGKILLINFSINFFHLLWFIDMMSVYARSVLSLMITTVVYLLFINCIEGVLTAPTREFLEGKMSTVSSDAHWVTEWTDNNIDSLISKVKRAGFFKPWGIPFASFDDVRRVFQNHKTLLIGDSVSMNYYIELIELLDGVVSNTSTGNRLMPDPAYDPSSAAKNEEIPLVYRHVRHELLFQAADRARELQFPIHHLGVESARNASLQKCGAAYWWAPYGISNARALNKIIQEDCFINHLRNYDTIIANPIIHDMVAIDGINNAKKAANEKLLDHNEEYSRLLTSIFTLLPNDIKQKLLWIGPKYEEAVSRFRPILDDANIPYIDWAPLISSCVWKNCTLEDHHHSRIIHRVLALNVTHVLHRQQMHKKRTSRKRQNPSTSIKHHLRMKGDGVIE